ncbi:hypothetical protein OSTOST_23768, partial [Ostertagia ostertagi]
TLAAPQPSTSRGVRPAPPRAAVPRFLQNSVVQQLLRSSSSSTDVQPPPATSSRFLGQREKCLEIRRDPRYMKCTTTEILEDMLEEYQNDTNIERLEEREEMMLRFHRGNLNSRRSAITKSKAFHKVRGMTWDNIPESFSRLHDGTRFLQLKTAQKAYRNGLHALVADGVHQILPEQLGDHSQLYTIHGVCNNGVEQTAPNSEEEECGLRSDP